MFITKHYARSVMERAILEAGQFAHVPASDVAATLDGLVWPCCEEVTVSLARGHKATEVGFYYRPTMQEFAVRFGTLCPVCLSVVGLEPRAGLRYSHEYMPSWFTYDGDSEYPVGSIHDEPEWYSEAWQRKDWPGLGVFGQGHARCRIVDTVYGWLGNGADEGNLAAASYFLRRRSGGFKDYLDWLSCRPRCALRFDPRQPTARRFYSDMRDVVDTIHTEQSP